MDPNIQIWKTRDHEFTLQVGRERVDRLNEMEVLAVLIVLLRGEGNLPPYFQGVDPDEAMHPRMPRGMTAEMPPKAEPLNPKASAPRPLQPDPNVLNVPFNTGEARDIKNGMADLLCWHRGYASARRADDDHRNDPMGVECVRRAREHLMRALDLHDDIAAADLPF